MVLGKIRLEPVLIQLGEINYQWAAESWKIRTGYLRATGVVHSFQVGLTDKPIWAILDMQSFNEG